MFLFVGINNKLINKVIKCLCGLNSLFIHGSSNCFNRLNIFNTVKRKIIECEDASKG